MIVHSGCDSISCSSTIYAVSTITWEWHKWDIIEQSRSSGRSWLVKPALPFQATGIVMATYRNKVRKKTCRIRDT